jgi:hypothetical protein
LFSTLKKHRDDEEEEEEEATKIFRGKVPFLTIGRGIHKKKRKDEDSIYAIIFNI